MGHGVNFTMREVTSSVNSYANCPYDIYQDKFSCIIIESGIFP